MQHSVAADSRRSQRSRQRLRVPTRLDPGRGAPTLVRVRVERQGAAPGDSPLAVLACTLPDTPEALAWFKSTLPGTIRTAPNADRAPGTDAAGLRAYAAGNTLPYVHVVAPYNYGYGMGGGSGYYQNPNDASQISPPQDGGYYWDDWLEYGPPFPELDWFYRRGSQAEREACKANIPECVHVAEAVLLAEQWAESITGEAVGGLEGRGDALRHAYGQAYLTLSHSKELAEKWAKLHEERSYAATKASWMDYWNNDIGRQLGEQIKAQGGWWMHKVDDAVLWAEQQGWLVLGLNDYRVPKNLPDRHRGFGASPTLAVAHPSERAGA